MKTRHPAPAALAFAVSALSPVVHADPDVEPVRTLGTVTVIGTRPTSLPTQIPTTIEGITAEEIAVAINATDAEDALKYLPSLLVRKRYIGDYDHAVLASRASGTGNSARSLVYADGILLSNLLGNGATFTPRWGMVTPGEIERVDVLYGPFSAAYPGNSVGAVVEYLTRMPDQFEAHVRATSFGQKFDVYSTDETYDGYQGSVSIGDRFGHLSGWLSYTRLDNDSQPLVYANKLVSSGTPGSAGTPVTGAIAGKNPRNQDWLLLGTTSQAHTVQDQAKLKLAYDFTPNLRASYTLGWWRNEAERASESWLRDASGNPVYAGTINVDGRSYTVAATDFAPSRGDLQHFMQGLSLKHGSGGAFDWEIAASLYDYDRDEVRSPTVALPAAGTGGAGRVTDQSGTSWNSIALKGAWRPETADHIVDFGYQRDDYKLRTLVSNTADWLNGTPASRSSAFRGNTLLQSLYAQDTWGFAADWRATLGLRAEQWEASDGAISNATSTLSFGERSETYYSPKAAIAYQLAPEWSLKASVGRAVRMPTVAELYQGSISTTVIVNNDPDLKPERSWTGELTARYDHDRGSLRATVFHEDTRDALYSQTNVTVTPNVTNIQNVDHIRTTGLELAGDFADVLVENLDLQASVTYAHSRIVENENFPSSEGKWQPRVPDWRANLLATYRMGEKWTTTLGLRYSGKQYNTLDNSDPNAFAYTGVSEFFTVDARVRYALTQQITLAISADNLNGDNYWNFHHYPQRTIAAELSMDF